MPSNSRYHVKSTKPRGQPRVPLYEVHRRWQHDKDAIEKSAKRSLHAFYRAMLAFSPTPPTSFRQVNLIFMKFADEIPLALNPPFAPIRTADDRKLIHDDIEQMVGARLQTGDVMPVTLPDGTIRFVGMLRLIKFNQTIDVYGRAYVWKWEADGNAGSPPVPPGVSTDEDKAYDEIVRATVRSSAQRLQALVDQSIKSKPQTIPSLPPPATDARPPMAYSQAPASRPDPSEPWMRDGSHLLACQAGRRKIDPATGKRMIREMVLTPDAWPHWKWVEDVEGEDGVGPWGPGVTIWSQHDPRNPSPRETMRPILEKAGKLHLLHHYSDKKY